MSQENPPNRSAGESSTERDKVISEVLEDQAKREAAREAARKAQAERPETSFYMQVSLLVMGTFFFYLLFFSPRWVTPTAAEPVAEQVRQDGLRFSVFLMAQRVEHFRLSNGRLPANDAELGNSEPNLSYQRVDDETYRLRAITEENEVIYTSGEPLSEFAEAASAVLEGRS